MKVKDEVSENIEKMRKKYHFDKSASSYLKDAYSAFSFWKYEMSPEEDFLDGLMGAAFIAGARWQQSENLIVQDYMRDSLKRVNRERKKRGFKLLSSFFS